MGYASWMQRTSVLLFVTVAVGCSTRVPSKTVAPPEPELADQVVTERTLPPVVAPDPAPEPEAPSLEESTVVDLCEPVDQRRPYPTKDERLEVRQLIRATCSALGVDANSCKYFLMVASRESSYRWWVRHKMTGDAAFAVRAWISAAHIYGWDVHWPARAQKREDLTAIVMAPRHDGANAYFPDVSRWMTGGLGLGGLNVGYHLAKFDRVAPPEILCDPTINVMVQVALARSAVDRYRASNLYEVQAVYAGRTYYDSNGRVRPLSCAGGCPKDIRGDAPKHAKQRARARKGDAMMTKRCKSLGIDCLAKPKFGRVLRGRDVTPLQRYEFAEAIRGAPLPDFPDPLDFTEVEPQIVDSLREVPDS